jgi:putative ABC transport system permease protein
MVSIALVTAAERPGLNAGYSATVTPLREQTVGRIRPLLQVLFATVLFVLLIACANVANLVLMRALGRDREMSVRLALGAGRWRLAHQLTVESLLLASAGGILGTVIATWGLRALLASLPVDFPLPRIHEIAVGSTVLWFAILLCDLDCCSDWPRFFFPAAASCRKAPKRISFRVAAPPPLQPDHGCHRDAVASHSLSAPA